MRALAIVLLMLSSCASRSSYSRGDGASTTGFECQPIHVCEQHGGGGGSPVQIGIVAASAAAALGLGALLHHIGNGPKRTRALRRSAP